MRPPKPTHIDRLTALAIAQRDEPNNGTKQRLADACLVYGLTNSERLSLAALAVVDRIAEVEDGVLVELASVLAAEQERRRVQSSGSFRRQGVVP